MGTAVSAIGNMTLRFFNGLGRFPLSCINELGGWAIFSLLALVRIFTPPVRPVEWIRQVYFVGVKSILVILPVALFAGMVLGLQGYYTLVKFGSEGLLGAAVALALIRELGPVLTAIMVVGRAGSSMAAEIGIMRISEQIDALDTMDIDPIGFLISPRIAASVLVMPLLTAVFDVVGIIGGWLTGVVLLHLNAGVYFHRIESSVGMADVTGGLIKALVFGLMVATLCCYQGYFTHVRPDGHGAKGVSLATTTAVVLSCVAVLTVDYILTSFLL
jgi:phospholipid/cholesterol/gamma-HCH transport system permease protein